MSFKSSALGKIWIKIHKLLVLPPWLPQWDSDRERLVNVWPRPGHHHSLILTGCHPFKTA